MNIVLLGADGQVGRALRETLPALGPVAAVGRASVDLDDAESVRALLALTTPRVVVNAAAYTAVDRAESEPEAAFAVNADAVQVIAEAARRTGALLVHYSTDYVFDGSKAAPYTEADTPNPLNA